MLIDLHPDSPVSICEQIVAQIIFNVASGGLAAGSLIPSVRELGARLTVHPNTVARAYQELERMGVLTVRRGRGMEVAADAIKLCRAERHDRVRQRIREALREAVSSGLPRGEVRRFVEEELSNHGNGKRTEPHN
jgi:GntR family transcriptional regulator